MRRLLLSFVIVLLFAAVGWADHDESFTCPEEYCVNGVREGSVDAKISPGELKAWVGSISVEEEERRKTDRLTLHPCETEPWLCDPVEKFEVLQKAFIQQMEELRGYRIALQAVREWGEGRRVLAVDTDSHEDTDYRMRYKYSPLTGITFIPTSLHSQESDPVALDIADSFMRAGGWSGAENGWRKIQVDRNGFVICSGGEP